MQARPESSTLETRLRSKPVPMALLAALAAIVLLAPGCVREYDIDIVRYDPARAWNGTTVFQSLLTGTLIAVSMQGEVLWEHSEPGVYVLGSNLGFEVLDDGTVLYMGDGRLKRLDPLDGTILWEDIQRNGHHSVTTTPHGTILLLTNGWFEVDHEPWEPYNALLEDIILEIDPDTGDVLWEWHLKDHLDPIEHHNPANLWNRDWSHANTVKFYPGYAFGGGVFDAVLLNSRHLDTFWMIDYATGEVIWSCGQHGDFGRREPPEEALFSHAHEVERIGPGRFLLFDNGNERAERRSRALEIAVDPLAGTAEEVWSWTEPSFVMYDWWAGDANRLPNGNTLVVNVTLGRIVEVTPAGEKVWEMIMRHPLEGYAHHIYKCERIPAPADPL